MRSFYATLLALLFLGSNPIHAFQICFAEPPSIEEVARSLEVFIENNTQIASQIAASSEHDFENTVKPWYGIWLDYQLLRQAIQTTLDQEMVDELDRSFSAIAHDPDLMALLISTARQAARDPSLGALDRQMIDEILGMKNPERRLLKVAVAAFKKSAPVIVQDILLCGGKAEVSVEQDSDGNTTLDAGVSVSTETDSGRFSAGISGGVSRDSNGNVDANVKMSGTISW